MIIDLEILSSFEKLFNFFATKDLFHRAEDLLKYKKEHNVYLLHNSNTFAIVNCKQQLLSSIDISVFFILISIFCGKTNWSSFANKEWKT